MRHINSLSLFVCAISLYFLMLLQAYARMSSCSQDMDQDNFILQIAINLCATLSIPNLVITFSSCVSLSWSIYLRLSAGWPSFSQCFPHHMVAPFQLIINLTTRPPFSLWPPVMHSFSNFAKLFVFVWRNGSSVAVNSSLQQAALQPTDGLTYLKSCSSTAAFICLFIYLFILSALWNIMNAVSPILVCIQ